MSMHVDGNALAGPLSEVYQGDVTTAMAMCSGCDEARPLGTLQVYASEMGLVGRCAGCGEVLLTLVRTPLQTVLNTSGMRWLRFAGAAAAAG